MTLKINFYCDEKYRGRVPEPMPAFKCIPKWFSKLPLRPERKYVITDENIYNLHLDRVEPNIKRCLGITEFLNTGYIIPAWADFIFREQENGDLYINWVENYFDTEYSSHSEKQYDTMPNKPPYGHFGKIFSPWTIKTDSGVSCLITHPTWHRNKSFTSTTAIAHTDVAPFQIPWFFEWNNKIETKMSIDNIDLEKQVVKKEEPIVLIIPFYRKKYTSTINYVSEQIIEGMYDSQLNLTNRAIATECPYVKFRQTLGKFFK